MKNVKRISIIGAPGTGKTVLANNLGYLYKLPVVHLDSIHYLDNWVLRDKEERDELILKEGNKEEWILDGTFIDTLQQRINHSDLIIFLDYSSFSQVKGIFKRRLTHLGKKRNDVPKLTLSFVFYVFTYNIKRKKYITEILKDIKKEKVLVFKNQKHLNKWLQERFKEGGIEISKINNSL